VKIYIKCGGENWIYWTVIVWTAVVERHTHILRVIYEEGRYHPKKFNLQTMTGHSKMK